MPCPTDRSTAGNVRRSGLLLLLDRDDQTIRSVAVDRGLADVERPDSGVAIFGRVPLTLDHILAE